MRELSKDVALDEDYVRMIDLFESHPSLKRNKVRNRTFTHEINDFQSDKREGRRNGDGHVS